MQSTHKGGCLCGGVRYEIAGALRDVVVCHCSQCRRTSGSFVAASRTLNAGLIMQKSETLSWYRSSYRAERGFCTRCGSNLFWRQTAGPGMDQTSIMAGTLDAPTGLKVMQHIFVADKSDYYEITDGLPQASQWPN